jgi:hypothetical protein
MEEYANQKLTDYTNQSHELMIELMAKGREDIYELMTKHTNLYREQISSKADKKYKS